jgi:phosphatidylethanolamine-binding protein (PEBP) family uncharacterized protein
MRFHLPQIAKICGVLTVTLALAGCGGSSSTSTPHENRPEAAATSASTAASKTAAAKSTPSAPGPDAESEAGEPNLALALTTVVPLRPIPARYTCDGANVPPPLTWSEVPHGTAEFALVVVNAKDLSNGKLFSDWGIAGLKPSLTSLTSAQLPPGAIAGRNSLGKTSYSVCPPAGKGEVYTVLLFALKHAGTIAPGFSVSGLTEKLLHSRVSEGLLNFIYKRG